MKKALAALSLIVLLSACKEGWTDEHKNAYRKSCLQSTATWATTKTQSENYCDCSLEQVMKHYKTIEEVIVNKDSLRLQQELEACKEAALREE